MNGTEIVTPEVTMNWGTWVQTIVDFLIVAFCIFIAIKAVNRMRRGKQIEAEAAEEAAAEPTKEEVLLTEIRDLLKQQADKK